LQVNRNNVIGTYLIMLAYRHLLTITLTWQNSCIIENYNRKAFNSIRSSIWPCYVFLHWWCKEVLVIDSGHFITMYVHMYKQLILCDVIRSCDNLLTPFCEFLTLYKTGRERKLTKDKRKDHGTVDESSLE